MPRPQFSLPLYIPRGNGSGFDIGAYEFVGPATPLPWEAIRAVIVGHSLDPVPDNLDLNLDGAVDVADLVLALMPGT